MILMTTPEARSWAQNALESLCNLHSLLDQFNVASEHYSVRANEPCTDLAAYIYCFVVTSCEVLSHTTLLFFSTYLGTLICITWTMTNLGSSKVTNNGMVCLCVSYCHIFTVIRGICWLICRLLGAFIRCRVRLSSSSFHFHLEYFSALLHTVWWDIVVDRNNT